MSEKMVWKMQMRWEKEAEGKQVEKQQATGPGQEFVAWMF